VNAPWYVRQPALLRSECRGLEREFPEMRRDERAFASGKLVFEGILVIGCGSKNERVVLLLEYPDAFPYARPEVMPLVAATAEGTSERGPRLFSARHQMANGSICLFERDPADDPRSHVSGVAALRRARIWLPHAMRGSLPAALDTLESELEAHYHRSGDVLLGPMMFEDLGPGGELILDFFRAPLRNEDYPLHMVSHVQANGSWRNDEQALQRIGSDRPPAFWSASPPSTPGLPRVRWYSLDHEPTPVRTTIELARLLFPGESEPLSRLKRDLASDLASRNAVDVPLRLRGRKERSIEWLFLRIPIRKASLPRAKMNDLQCAGQVLDFSGGDALDDAPIGILRTHDLRQRSLAVRNAARVPRGAETLSLGLAGAGSLGSACADLLGKAGVGGLRIVDPALLNAHNSVRHLAGVSSAGMPKAGIVAAIVNAHNPHCEITCGFKGVLDLPEDDPLWKCSCVLSTIADDATELAFNRLAVSRGATAYYLRALRSGSAGRLVRVRPGIDACLECLGHYHAEGDSRAVVIPAQHDEVITRECGQPVLASSAADLAIVAGLAVRTLLADLCACADKNQWVWTSEGIAEHEQLRQPFSSMSVALPPHETCGVCAVAVPRRVRVSAAIRADMVAQARRHAPNETGGILIGRSSRDVVDVLAASDAGLNAVSRPTRFERDGAYCQRYLEEVATKTGTGIDYVGEWHSHPGSSAIPSVRDTTSFEEIAIDTDYLTTTPLLIIVAPKADDQVEWSFTVFPAGGLARTVELEDVSSDVSGPPSAPSKPAA